MPEPDPKRPQAPRPAASPGQPKPKAKPEGAAGKDPIDSSPGDKSPGDKVPPPLPRAVGAAGASRSSAAPRKAPSPPVRAPGAPPPIPVPPKRTNFRARIETSRRNNVKKAGLFVLLVAFLQLTLGLYTGYQQHQECEKARSMLATMDSGTELELETGQPTVSRRGRARDAASETVTVTAGELRTSLSVIGKIAVLLPAVLGLGFLACFVWARSQPWHALLAALALFCFGVTVAFVFDPSSLLKGIPLKIVTLVMLLGGIRDAAALQRNADAARRLAPAAVRRPGVRRGQASG